MVTNLFIYLCQDLSFICDAIQSIHLYCAFALVHPGSCIFSRKNDLCFLLNTNNMYWRVGQSQCLFGISEFLIYFFGVAHLSLLNV